MKHNIFLFLHSYGFIIMNIIFYHREESCPISRLCSYQRRQRQRWERWRASLRSIRQHEASAQKKNYWQFNFFKLSIFYCLASLLISISTSLFSFYHHNVGPTKRKPIKYEHLINTWLLFFIHPFISIVVLFIYTFICSGMLAMLNFVEMIWQHFPYIFKLSSVLYKALSMRNKILLLCTLQLRKLTDD